MPETYYCEKCGRTMGPEAFYTSTNLEKYPSGKLKSCKKCITMHVDNWDPDTFLWILQECDVPYVPKEWDSLLLRFGQDKSKLTGLSIFGRYLSKMKLKQYKDFRWKDSDYLQEMENHKMTQAMKKQGFDAQEISQAVEKATQPIPEGILEEPEYAATQVSPSGEDEYAPIEDYFAIQSGGVDDFIDDLTDEDRTYLRLKWGKTYRPEEWVRLEQLYEEMMSSYDIQGAGHIDTLKLICKTSLKANQLIDISDVEGFQKMSKVYDSLMKSGRFTAAQNKTESGEFIDSISELVELCEKEGYIERFYVDSPNDKVDITIRDMQQYTRTLIERETNLSNLIESAVRENLKEDERNADTDSDEIIFDDDIDFEQITDKDLAQFNDFLDEEEELTNNFISSLLDGDEE